MSSTRKDEPPAGASPGPSRPGGGGPPAGDTTGPPGFPVETEIFILPDGRVMVVDLPAELAGLVAGLGSAGSTPQVDSAE